MADITRRAQWESMKEAKPINPDDYAGIDYGYVVRVKEGDHAEKEGLAVMFSRLGDIGVKLNFPDKPCFLNGYDLRVQPENLEVLAKMPLTKLEWMAFKDTPSPLNGMSIETDTPLFIYDKRFERLGQFFETPLRFGTMQQMRIRGVDRERLIYAGDADCVDEIERFPFAVHWIAHPFQNLYEINGRKYAFKVRSTDADYSFRGNFTLNRDFDDMIEHYIMHGILEFNPDLPVLGA